MTEKPLRRRPPVVNTGSRFSTAGFRRQTLYCYRYESDTSSDQSNFTYKEDNNDKRFEWSGYGYSSKSNIASCWIPPIFAATGQLEFQYSVGCTARTSTTLNDGVMYPCLSYETRIKLWADIVYDSGHSKGTVFDQTLNANIGFQIDAYGNITIIKQADKKHTLTMDRSGWAEFASFGGVDDCIDGISDNCVGWVEGSVNQIKDHFLHNFLFTTNWVMPGKKTFSFKNECFSADADFCSGIVYMDA